MKNAIKIGGKKKEGGNNMQNKYARLDYFIEIFDSSSFVKKKSKSDFFLLIWVWQKK